MKYNFQQVFDLSDDDFLEIFSTAFKESGLNQADLSRKSPRLNSAMLSRLCKHGKPPKDAGAKYEVLRALDLIQEGDSEMHESDGLWRGLYLEERQRYDNLLANFLDCVNTLKKELAGTMGAMNNRPARTKQKPDG